MLRDFTEAFFDEYYKTLTTESLDEAYVKEIEEWQNSFWSNIFGDYPPGATISRWCQKTFGADEFTKSEIRRIQDDVYAVEDSYSSTSTATQDALRDLENIIIAYRDCFVSGSDPYIDFDKLSEDLGDAAEALNAARDKMLQEEIDKFYNEDGTINWDAVEAFFNQDISNVNSLQLAALAHVYLNIDPNDSDAIELFLSLGYNRTPADHPYLGKGYGEIYGEQYYNYEINPIMLLLAAVVMQTATAEAEGTIWDSYESQNLSEEDAQKIRDKIQMALALDFICSYWQTTPCPIPEGTKLFDFGDFGKDNKFGAGGFENDIDGSGSYLEVTIPEDYILHGDSSADNAMFTVAQNYANLEYKDYLDYVESIVGTLLGIASGLAIGLVTGGLSAAGAAIVKYGVTAVKLALALAEINSNSDDGQKGADLVNLIRAIELLGGRVLYTMIDGKIIIHYISLNTTEAQTKIAGFLKDHPEMTADDLFELLKNGDGKSEWYDPLDEDKYGSEEDQLSLYKEFCEYDSYGDYDGPDGYVVELQAKYDNPANKQWIIAVFGHTYDGLENISNVLHLPSEVLQALINM